MSPHSEVDLQRKIRLMNAQISRIVQHGTGEGAVWVTCFLHKEIQGMKVKAPYATFFLDVCPKCYADAFKDIIFPAERGSRGKCGMCFQHTEVEMCVMCKEDYCLEHLNPEGFCYDCFEDWKKTSGITDKSFRGS